MTDFTDGAEVPCADCRTNPSNLEVRKRRLCNDCFQKYINSKVLKRMESYRFKHQVGNSKRRLFLPLSGGVSSLVLLQVLDNQVKRQLAQQGRTAYDLVIGHVRTDENAKTQSEGDFSGSSWFTQTVKTFEMHKYLPPHQLSDVLFEDTALRADLTSLGFTRQDGVNDKALIEQILRAPKSVTSRTDLREILQHRLIVALAQKNECESIIWGHSDSRLAAKALSEVAKGRGAAVPNGLADGPTKSGFNFNYPLRDLFKTELDLYLKSLPEEIKQCLAEDEKPNTVPVSIRNTSIDDLLSAYITTQGEKYPSIMANVVKTASKLQVPDSEEYRSCQFCTLPITTGKDIDLLCYGCQRMKQDIKT